MGEAEKEVNDVWCGGRIVRGSRMSDEEGEVMGPYHTRPCGLR